MIDMEQIHKQAEKPKPTSSSSKFPEPNWGVSFGLVGQIGYVIAIPAVIFAIGGAYLDKYTGLSPLFVILGLSLAFLISAFGVARVIRTILELGNEKK